jgi:hypothetical protein
LAPDPLLGVWENPWPAAARSAQWGRREDLQVRYREVFADLDDELGDGEQGGDG